MQINVSIHVTGIMNKKFKCLSKVNGSFRNLLLVNKHTYVHDYRTLVNSNIFLWRYSTLANGNTYNETRLRWPHIQRSNNLVPKLSNKNNTHTFLIMFPLKKISHLRGTNSSWSKDFYLVILPFHHTLKHFTQVSNHFYCSQNTVTK
jgi:hypothetical protein